jgi:hypothetical protein
MALLFAMHPHAREYFFPSLRRFGILSAHATISVGVYGSLSPNSAFKRNVISTAVTAFPGFPEYPLDVILKACHAGSFPQGPRRWLELRNSSCPFPHTVGTIGNLGLAGNPYIGHEAQKIQIPLDYRII